MFQENSGVKQFILKHMFSFLFVFKFLFKYQKNKFYNILKSSCLEILCCHFYLKKRKALDYNMDINFSFW